MNKPSLTTRRLAPLALAALMLTTVAPSQGATALADQPVYSSVAVPGNLALALSVEFPTAVSNAHIDGYSTSATFLGYFDPEKCYDYVYDATETSRYFAPSSAATAHVCSGKWSGNFLNWATMQTIDPFRWALTGGYRVSDSEGTTIIEKAYATGQGGTGNFPDRSLSSGQIAGATPLGWTGFNMRIQGLGNKMRFTRTGDNNGSGSNAYGDTSNSNYSRRNGYSDSAVWEVSVRVKVCDPTVGTEANCKKYSNTNYKPEGLIQKYSDQIRFAAFGYLNDGNLSRDGGVLRARMKFVGPTRPVPGSSAVTNTAAEWNATTGVMALNPDTADATTTTAVYGTISNSGVMNYLNKFGQITPGSYKTYDPVGELYYTVMRYYRNVGNVPSYTNPGTTNSNTLKTYADGFPVITTWDDPIQYSCQKNYVLGIGDVNTHADRNLPGTTGGSEPSQPSAVSSDYSAGNFDPVFWTNKVGAISGINGSLGTVQNYNGCCSNNGALMAGMAYWANTQDIRSDLTGTQNVQTYWLDVQEYQSYKANNQFYLAAKYGGAVLPSGFDSRTRTTDLDQTTWHTGGSSDTVGGQLRPDTYFTAAKADLMVNGLTTAFASIASRMKGYTSSFNTASDKVVSTGEASYASQYNASDWSGEVIASLAVLDYTRKNADNTYVITQTDAWRLSEKLATQLAGSGWDTGRNMVTYNPSSAAGVAFRTGNLTSDQLTALNTTYRSGDDSADYLNYVRGDRSQEQNSTTTNSSKAYRTRSVLVGDIVAAAVTVVGPPGKGDLADATNPGYSTYVSNKQSRGNYLVVGTNAGVIHVVDGALSGDTAGKELFAFVPNAVIKGPNNTPSVDGLASVGNPTFAHHYLVDSQPVVANVDFGKTSGGSGTDWRTIVVGGLGKGGRSIYALDMTDPGNVSTEAGAASRVLWEFTDSDMGFTYGQPLVAKTAQYGWVVIFGSGYNTSSGHGWFYIVNARTGALLQKVALNDSGTATSPVGLTNMMTYFRDTTDGTAESVYAGDLLGGLWRLDLTATSGSYPSPVKLANLTDTLGNPQPVTTRPMPAIYPGSKRRWITVGTGKLLDSSDINSALVQRFYAIVDGTETSFASSATLPSGVSLPLSASNMMEVTDTTRGITMDYNSRAGWYLNLGLGVAGNAYRVLADPSTYNGQVIFAATAPSSADPCAPSGASKVYALDLGTGLTLIQDGSPYVTTNYAVTSTRWVQQTDSNGNATGDPQATFSGVSDKNTCAYGTNCNDSGFNLKAGAGTATRLINWREVPLRN